MSDPHEPASTCRRATRRGFLGGAALGAAAGAGAMYGWRLRQLPDSPRQSPIHLPPERSAGLAIPGRFPGRVVEVHHGGAARGNVRNRAAVRQMLARGLSELVGAPDPVAAWRSMFAKGDRVGIKVVPVGRPDSISSPELVLEVIDALATAGVRLRDILVFERYEDEFRDCGYHELLPEGVHWECSSVRHDEQQVNLDGQLPDVPRSKHVAGYDRDQFRELPYCHPRHDPADDRRFRSHVSRIVTQKVDKFISLPVLKDHRSAGVTLSLKNLSHGLVNNVARSHIANWDYRGGEYTIGSTMNQCGTFIPSMVSLPAIREKAVLQILDGLVATYEGGPKIDNPTFATWNANRLWLATDPVALDHVGWLAIDAQRAAEGWPGVGEMGLDGKFREVTRRGILTRSEQFHMRQPEHVPLAGTLGLGEFSLAKIDHRRIAIG